MEKQNKRVDERDDQVFVWQGYTGKVELISFRTFLTKPVRRVALGGDHSLILTYDDCLFSCGNNEHGQLGVPSFGQSYSFDPCLVDALSGKGVQGMACGVNHSGCLTGQGDLYCWGDNTHGQCGQNPTHHKSVNSPGHVELSIPETVCEHGVISPECKEHVCQVSCGTQHTLALSREGRVWTWGQGPQLGLGGSMETWQPNVVHKLVGKKVIQIASGDLHNVIIVEETKVTSKQVLDVQSATKDTKLAEDKVTDIAKLTSVCAKCNADTSKVTDAQSDSCIMVDNHFRKSSSNTTNIEISKNQNTDLNETTGKTDEKQKTDSDDRPKATDIVGTEPTTLNDEVFVVDDVTNNAETETAKPDLASDTAETKEAKENQPSSQDAILKPNADCDKSLEESVLSNMVEQDFNVNSHGQSKSEEIVINVTDETGEDAKKDVNESSSDTVTMRNKIDESKFQSMGPLTDSLRSDSSMTSSYSSKYSRSKSFLDETGAREFLARQFQDEDVEPLTASLKLKSRELIQAPSVTVTPTPVSPSSPSAYMMQTVTSLTSQVTSVTSHMTSMTTKALSSMVPDRLKFTTGSSPTEEETRSSTETLGNSEISELEDGSSENLNDSVLDFSNLTMSDLSLNSSQLSLPDSEKSSEGLVTPESSPAKKKKEKRLVRKSVSKDPQSIRTIEAKQENLRRISLSLPPMEEQENVQYKPTYSLDTELWVWGKNNKGQLGLGDTEERSEPYCLQIMSGKRIVHVVCGAQHSLALTSNGEVYSWGRNVSGQLGHSEESSYPAKIELTFDCCIWDMAAGSNHSIFLMDNASTNGSKPEVYYAGKHPCKDLYVPIYKTPRLTPLKFVRKAGWIHGVMTGGDNCACISSQETDMVQMTFTVTRLLRQLYLQLHKVIQVYIKRIQISGYYTTLQVYPYKEMLDNIMITFIQLTKQIGVASLEMTDLLRQGDSILHASIFTQYDVFMAQFKHYATAFADMVAVGGFEYCVKSGSTLFENLSEFYMELLPTPTKSEAKLGHAAKFRQIMFIPLNGLKDLSQMVHNYADLFEKSSKETNLLSSVHLNLEHLIRTSNTSVTDAENTQAFWENTSSKIADSLKTPNRRLIKESKSSPLTLSGGGRFSTHVFYLFNDIFIHQSSGFNMPAAKGQNIGLTPQFVPLQFIRSVNLHEGLSVSFNYSTHQSYPLETVWIDTPSAESSNHQNMITITTPEDVLNVYTSSAQVKTEWVVAFNTAINKVLSRQKSVSRQDSGERVHTPVIRLATHTFIKHATFKDATYKGYWLNGKVHGSGLIKWPDGKRFKGKFKTGQQSGYGKLCLPKEGNKEEIQEGVWKDGKLHGHGQIRYSTGDLYDGYFKDGQRHGHGVYRKGRYLNSASFVYVGEWLYDKKHGYGVMDDILKGEKYMGMWQDDNRHGDGIVVTLDGMYFEGNFQYNKLVGHGLMLTDDNSIYEGEFAGITLLQGKGTLTFPVGDKIEGTFNGTWNQGLKITGTFYKTSLTASNERRSPTREVLELKSSLYGKLCVRPERKWEEIFYQCYESLKYSGQGEPNITKAWDQVVTCIMAGKQTLKDKEKKSLTSKQKLELSNLEQLEKIPTHGVEILTIEQYLYVLQYLNKAFETHCHPLGRLVEDLVDVFRAAYIGIGAHPRLLYHAVQEIHSYIHRIYKVTRILFPELPGSGGPIHVYPEKSRHASTPLGESMGFIQRQISETEEEDTTIHVVSSAGILQSILLPKIYPALFDLYALNCDREDEKYWERMQKLNKQGDMSLMAYLGVDQNFWCMDDSLFKDQRKRLSSMKDQCYSKPIEVLQELSTAFCPQDKLEVIERTFLTMSQTVRDFLGEDHLWCMDDLFPIFQFVVIRARIHHLGAEIHFIEDLMESHLEYGEYGIMFTTLQACYYQIQNEKMPIH